MLLSQKMANSLRPFSAATAVPPVPGALLAVAIRPGTPDRPQQSSSVSDLGAGDLARWRHRGYRLDAARTMPAPELARAAQPVPRPRPAIEPAPEVHLPLHRPAPGDLAVILSTVHLRDDR